MSNSQQITALKQQINNHRKIYLTNFRASKEVQLNLQKDIAKLKAENEQLVFDLEKSEADFADEAWQTFDYAERLKVSEKFMSGFITMLQSDKRFSLVSDKIQKLIGDYRNDQPNDPEPVFAVNVDLIGG